VHTLLANGLLQADHNDQPADVRVGGGGGGGREGVCAAALLVIVTNFKLCGCGTPCVVHSLRGCVVTAATLHLLLPVGSKAVNCTVLAYFQHVL
jgi:hypothetical protein